MFYVQIKGKTLGPLGDDRVRRMLELGQIGPDSQVSQDQMTWAPILSVDALRVTTIPPQPSPAPAKPLPAERRSPLPQSFHETTVAPSPISHASAAEVRSSRLANSKVLLFTLAGLLGGGLGNTLAEFLIDQDSDATRGFLELALRTGSWGLLWGIGITTALLAANELYSRRPLISSWVAANGLWRGATCGFLSGALAQVAYSLPVRDELLRELLFKPACWGIAGMILGLLLSFSIPNLGKGKGTIAGLIGGLLGGVAFVVLGAVFLAIGATSPIAGSFSRVVGVAVIGAAVGLAITVAEAVFRTAHAEVVWGARERTTVSLGPEPVWFGGGRSQIFVKGLPCRAAGMVMRSGRIVFTDTDGAERNLGDGETVQIGHLQVVVHATK